MAAITTFPPVSGVNTDNYYDKTEVESLIASAGAGGTINLTDYYKKLETYSKAQVDAIISSGTTDLSDYYTRAQVDGLLDSINTGEVSLDDYYTKTQTEILLSNKVEKEVGKGLSTNDFTDAFKQALEANKVQNISTDSTTKKLIVTYTDGTSADLNLDDVITDVKVEGAVLDATTNTLTIVSSEGGADVVIDLSLFVTTQTLYNALSGKAVKIHSHSTSDITGLDVTLAGKVTKNEAIIGDTKTKITYDSKGLVTNGTDLVASDIPDLPQSKITNLVSDLSDKQAKLVSGTNIRTINGQSVLGSGDILITGGSSGGGVDLTTDTLKAVLKELEDGTVSSKEYIVLINREDDKVSALSLNTLIDVLVSSIEPSTGEGSGLSAEDRTKLDGIEEEATKNETDGFLLSRSNHTGSIPMSVVENLEQALTNISLGGMTSAELLRIEDIESDITKKADLDSSGKIPASQLPDIASGRKIKVDSEVDRLTISAYPDLTIAYQMDDGSSWVINGNDDPSNVDNWTKLGSALISQVSSFNGRTGNVSPETGDYTSEMIAETDEKQFASKDEKISWNNRLTDADMNGKLYGRRNGEWAEIVSSGANPEGTINANEKEQMLSRSNHTGLQPMDTISGLAESLLGKADINTVYAEPMSTNYTTRNEILEDGKTISYPLNGVNSNYALHAFVLKETSTGSEVFSLNTVLMDSGYYGVKIPRINNIQLSLPSNTPEPLKRMTAHNQHGQTVSATTEYSASYAVWRIFSEGDTPSAYADSWLSSRRPTPSDPQIITFTSPYMFLMSSYKIRNRSDYVSSPRTWRMEGRVGDFGDWELIHEVIDDTINEPNLDRVFDIPKENRKACDQHRLVIFEDNGEAGYLYSNIARLVIYQEPSKFMIEDGVDKYRSTSTGYSLSYTPMTNYSEHNQGVSATSEHTADYSAWKVLSAEDALSSVTDCWLSSAAPTALAPQILTIDFGQPKKVYSYSITNRFSTSHSPSTWSIEVRNSLLDDWVTIDRIQGDKDNNSLSVRNFSIAEEHRGEWRYFRIVITDRNGTGPYTAISRLRIYGDPIGEELEPVTNVTTKNDITVNGTSDGVFISKEKLSTLSDPYIITDEPSAINLTIDSEREFEYSNNVKIVLANTYIKFTTAENGKYKFCYQEPAPDTP